MKWRIYKRGKRDWVVMMGDTEVISYSSWYKCSSLVAYATGIYVAKTSPIDHGRFVQTIDAVFLSLGVIGLALCLWWNWLFLIPIPAVLILIAARGVALQDYYMSRRR